MSGSARRYSTYGLNGQPETRIEGEFDNLYKVKGDAQLVKYTTPPSVTAVPEAQPILVNVAGNWYIYIRINSKFYKTAALTAV